MRALHSPAGSLTLLLAVCTGTTLHAQRPPAFSSLPGTAPTTLQSPTTPTTPIAATSVSAATVPSRRAVVTYSAGLLNVRANNSSLNGILREVSKQTGMKITGGVADQRVFGNYGPAEPTTILATLLDGTGSNMLIRETPGSAPAELVLTPRGGGPTPPNPNAGSFDAELPPEDDQSAQPATMQGQPATFQVGTPGQARPAAPDRMPQPAPGTSGPVSIQQPWNNVNGSASNTSPTASTLPVTNSVPIDTVPTPSTTPSTTGIVDSPNPPPAGSTIPGTITPMGTMLGGTSSAGTTSSSTSTTSTSGTSGTTGTSNSTPQQKTPEQIFQQLQLLRQQSQQQQNGTSTTPSTTTTNPQ